MTGLNHAATGALVAAAIHQPEIALPAAFLSHFGADVIPHWNYRVPGNAKKKQFVMVCDLVLSIIFLWLISEYSSRVPGWQLAAGGALAISPDFMWLPYFLTGKDSKMHKNTLLHFIRRLHIRIQLSETDRGLWIEAVWFVLVIIALGRLSR